MNTRLLMTLLAMRLHDEHPGIQTLYISGFSETAALTKPTRDHLTTMTRSAV
jgi:hypothetical protein